MSEKKMKQLNLVLGQLSDMTELDTFIAMDYPQLNIAKYVFGTLENNEKEKLEELIKENILLGLIVAGIRMTVKEQHLKNENEFRNYISKSYDIDI